MIDWKEKVFVAMRRIMNAARSREQSRISLEHDPIALSILGISLPQDGTTEFKFPRSSLEILGEGLGLIPESGSLPPTYEIRDLHYGDEVSVEELREIASALRTIV